MGLSIIQTQREVILDTIRKTTQGDWKVLVLDEKSKKLLYNVVKEDDILNENITHVELVESRRQVQDMDAIYILSPLPHIVDCVMADFERRRYKRSFLLWTSILPPPLRQKIDSSETARAQIGALRVINLDYYPRESHIATFRDPWSFPILFHPACSNLVRHHIADLSQKIVAVCVSLGEYPVIRYYQPPHPPPTHEASILCSIIAGAVQEEIDTYAKWNADFPPPSNRPRAALYIVDRSMDLFAPFLHEFTYQAMVHDLLPLRDGEKVTYKTIVNEGEEDQEEKDMEIGEKDSLWVSYRHRHMKDTIAGIESDFKKFIRDNPHFANSNGTAANINTIKTMLAGLPQFQELKEAYSLHLSMAGASMDVFQKHQLSELAALEQILSTGLDEDYKKPKNVADQTIRMLDEEAVVSSDRLRLIAMYVLFKDGLLQSDIRLLCNHAKLAPQDEEVLRHMELLGARVYKQLKDQKPPPQPLFPQKPPPPPSEEDSFLSRFEPLLKRLLEHHVAGTLDHTTFPFMRPDPSHQMGDPAGGPIGSLRSNKPTWAKSKFSSTEPRQRVIIFMAGGATYSEARSCYEITNSSSRDVLLLTTHMLSPSLWMRQLGDLGAERRRIGLPQDAPPKRAPDHLFIDDTPKPPPIAKQQLPNPPPPTMTQSMLTPPHQNQPGAGAMGLPSPVVKQMQNLSVNGGASSRPASAMSQRLASGGVIKLGSGSKSANASPEGKEKKKKHLLGFGSKK